MTESAGTEQPVPVKPPDRNTEQPVPEKPAEPLKFLADKGLGLLGLFAAAAYALSRPLYDAFYSPLGLRPEDLGLSQVEMISRGASAVFVIVLLFAVPIMLGVALYHSLLMRPLILQLAVLGILAALGLFLLRDQPGELEVTVLQPAGIFVIYPSFIAGSLLLFRSGRRNHRQMLFPNAPRLVPWLLACSAIGVALFYLNFFGWRAARDAGERFLQTGHVDQRWSGFLNIRADQVSITPLAEDKLKICNGQHDGYLLGRPEGAVFVLLVPRTESATDRSTVVRLSNEDYSVVVRENAVACKVDSEPKTN